MRILLHAGIDVSLPGGLETHVRELAAGLAARGNRVTIQGRASSPVPLDVVEHADPSGFDVMHVHGGAWPRGLPDGLRLVRTLHFCVAAKMAAYVRLGRLRTLVHPGNWRAVAGERAAGGRPARLIAVAERVRRDFARWHRLDPMRVEVIPNGFSPRPPVEPRAALRRRHGIAEDTPVLLTIGRDDFVKGFGLLGRAWARSGAAARGAVWVTVGGRAETRAAGRIVTGPVPHAAVADWIAAADVGALPSYYEGCSVALLEMLAGRLYTLSHDVGNAPEVIRPRDNGELIPAREADWAEALRRVLDIPPPRPIQGLDAAYTWPEIVRRTEEVYERVLAAT